MARYLYSILRYMPDRALGECINIGFIVGRDGDEWQYVELSPLKRLRWFSRQWAGAAHENVQEIARDVSSEERLMWWHAHTIWGVVSVSRPMPISSESTQDAVDFMCRHVFKREAA